MSQLHLVIARYKENISWVEKFKSLDHIQVTVYNKHSGENQLPNVGREAHTYVHHIIKDYDSPSEHYLFLQGNPFEHEKPKGTLEDLILNYSKYTSVGYQSLNEELSQDLNALPGSLKEGLPIGFLYEKIFGENTSPQVFEFSPGACFFVKGKLINNLTKEQWIQLYQYLSRSFWTVEAWVIERLWKTFFYEKSKKNYLDLKEIKKYGKYPPNEYLEELLKNNKVPMLKPWAAQLGYDYRK